MIPREPPVSSSRCRHPSIARNPTAPAIPAEVPRILSPDCARQLRCGRQTMIGQRSDHARRRAAPRFRPNGRNQSSPPRTAGSPLSDHSCKVGSAHRIGMRTSMRQWRTRFLWQNPADGRLTSILPGARYWTIRRRNITFISHNITFSRAEPKMDAKDNECYILYRA